MWSRVVLDANSLTERNKKQSLCAMLCSTPPSSDVDNGALCAFCINLCKIHYAQDKNGVGRRQVCLCLI